MTLGLCGSPVPDTPFYNVRLAEDEDTIFATIDFFGQPHHAMFVKVIQEEDSGWKAARDPYDRLEDIYAMYDAALVPIEIPGLEGHWMLAIHPWGD